jgi:hypothetical protein
MSSKISTSDIRNVHIYNRRTNPSEFKLCQKHRLELSDSIAGKLDQLVATKFFQNQFKDFLPNHGSNEEVHVRIRITDRHIIVQEIDEHGVGIGQSQKVNLNDVEPLETEDIDDADHINQSILRKANRIYQDHLSESRYRGRSVPPLRGRAERYKHSRHRERSPFPKRQRLSDYSKSERDEHERSVFHSPERRSHKSHARAHSASPTFSHRHGRMQRKKNNVPSSVETELDLFDSKFERLRAIETAMGTQHPSSTAIAPSVKELRRLKILKRDLERQLETISAENEVLKVHLPKMTSSISSEDFDALMQLSQTLSATDLSGSTHFPGELKEKFTELSEAIRNAIYYQTYLLIDPLEALDPWPIGQKLFEGAASSESAMNLCRSHAIRHFLLHTLASDFSSVEGKFPPPELIRRFEQLPEEDKSSVYTQLEFIQPKGHDYKGPAHAFAGIDRLSVTNQERSIAIHRMIFDRIAEYHRYRYREDIKAIERAFQEAYEKLRADSLS